MKNKEDLFLNTIQFPRKVSDKIEETATNGPWWYLPDCAHPIGHELQTDRNPYFSCSLITVSYTHLTLPTICSV